MELSAAKCAGARCGVQGTFAVSGYIETPTGRGAALASPLPYLEGPSTSHASLLPSTHGQLKRCRSELSRPAMLSHKQIACRFGLKGRLSLRVRVLGVGDAPGEGAIRQDAIKNHR